MTAVLDLWETAIVLAARTQIPDTDDPIARHQRGWVQLPWNTSDATAGAWVPAWVCCDPGCAGVELNATGLDGNHYCCSRWFPGQHMAGHGHRWNTGFHHGPLTPHWRPTREET